MVKSVWENIHKFDALVYAVTGTICIVNRGY